MRAYEIYQEYEEPNRFQTSTQKKVERALATAEKEGLAPSQEALDLRDDYESQVEALKHTGILEQLSGGELGIHGIDGREYHIPNYEEVERHMSERSEALKIKIEQGFTKLLLVPFGMSLDTLAEKYKETILKHHSQGKLFATKKEPTDPDVPLELDTNQPLWIWDEYKGADQSGKLVYNPKEFSQNHGGKTKTELLGTDAGWRILLIEDMPNIPRQNQGKTLGTRPQLEANMIPRQYLEKLGLDSYKDEVGMTPEDQLTYTIIHLETTNQVIDDYQGNGSVSYQIGAYFPASELVPSAFWYRDDRQAYLSRDNAGDRAEDLGVRSAVRV